MFANEIDPGRAQSLGVRVSRLGLKIQGLGSRVGGVGCSIEHAVIKKITEPVPHLCHFRMRCTIFMANHTVDFKGFVGSNFEHNVTKFAPHKALNLFARGKLTFHERVVVHLWNHLKMSQMPGNMHVQKYDLSLYFQLSESTRSEPFYWSFRTGRSNLSMDEEPRCRVREPHQGQ